MGGALKDAVTVIRCTGMVRGFGRVAEYIVVDAPRVIRTFDTTVKPLIDSTLTDDPILCQNTYNALLATAVRVSLAIRAYARMADVEFDAPLAVLGGAFTRVYDDLFDHFYDPGLDERLAELFRGREVRPQCSAEALANVMYRAIVQRLARADDDPFFEIVRRLHDFESASCRQLDPLTSAEEVRRITWGKGGYGVQALCSLLRPGLVGREADLVMELGHVLQLIDDHHDVAVDRAEDVVTSVTLGDATLAALATRIRRLLADLRAHYGRTKDRQLAATLFIMLIGAYISHHGPKRPPPASPAQPAGRNVWRLMFAEAGHMAPRRTSGNSEPRQG